MGFWGWLFTIISVAVVFGIAQAIATSSKKKSMESRLKSIPNFTVTQQVMGCDGNTGIALDEQRKKLCLISSRAPGISERLVSYRDICSVELFEDGSSITKTSRSSQIGGALVGGLVLGGVGAIIGGLSGKTKTSTKVKRIDLRLVVNDTASPLHDVSFMDLESKKDSIIYKQAISQARRWHGVIEVLIKRADAEDHAEQANARTTALPLAASLIADELRKLADLHASGVLTAGEFQQQKARLLGAGGESA